MTCIGQKLYTDPNSGVRIAVSEVRGKREKMEDTSDVKMWGHLNRAMVGIYDGHGGANVAKWCRDNVLDRLKNVPLDSKSISATFLDIDSTINKEIEESYSCGSTAIVGAISVESGKLVCTEASKKNRFVPSAKYVEKHIDEFDSSAKRIELTIAHIGDVRGLVFDGSGNLLFSTIDHVPGTERENKRIFAAGKTVTFDGTWRLGPVSKGIAGGQYNLSRAFGDHMYKTDEKLPRTKQAIIALCDIVKVQLFPGATVILACDGLFERLDNTEISNFIKTFNEKKVASDRYAIELSYSLTRFAMDSQSSDNITVAVLHLDTGATSDVPHWVESAKRLYAEKKDIFDGMNKFARGKNLPRTMKVYNYPKAPLCLPVTSLCLPRALEDSKKVVSGYDEWAIITEDLKVDFDEKMPLGFDDELLCLDLERYKIDGPETRLILLKHQLYQLVTLKKDLQSELLKEEALTSSKLAELESLNVNPVSSGKISYIQSHIDVTSRQKIEIGVKSTTLSSRDEELYYVHNNIAFICFDDCGKFAKVKDAVSRLNLSEFPTSMDKIMDIVPIINLELRKLHRISYALVICLPMCNIIVENMENAGLVATKPIILLQNDDDTIHPQIKIVQGGEICIAYGSYYEAVKNINSCRDHMLYVMRENIETRFKYLLAVKPADSRATEDILVWAELSDKLYSYFPAKLLPSIVKNLIAEEKLKIKKECKVYKYAEELKIVNYKIDWFTNKIDLFTNKIDLFTNKIALFTNNIDIDLPIDPLLPCCIPINKT